jgi:hypothetical protein
LTPVTVGRTPVLVLLELDEDATTAEEEVAVAAEEVLLVLAVDESGTEEDTLGALLDVGALADFDVLVERVRELEGAREVEEAGGGAGGDAKDAGLRQPISASWADTRTCYTVAVPNP